MIRIDILGVPGVGKTTTCNWLGQCRKNPREFLLFEEAYKQALSGQLSFTFKLAGKMERLMISSHLFTPLANRVNHHIDNEIAKIRYCFEKEKAFDQLMSLGLEFPIFYFCA